MKHFLQGVKLIQSSSISVRFRQARLYILPILLAGFLMGGNPYEENATNELDTFLV